ncbi:hypothetical protein A6F68_00951 [Tsuneonella dongtanensis]|uniref:DUF2891 domain-containing protein n=1 Tax=Tsuneonella dongtanensis TaxID=692370 RepID=A0A1B2ABF5_9SPHN|nr:DUF2891 domain-containing protein [Tsuneonella dongtanensis]ANY19476.1 hypothetical protein A6F68_00951 [Tsuneonella dongtanensis]
MLTETHARTFAQMTLPNLTRRWPYKLDQVIQGPDDVVAPAELHPIFHGSFDWHSCVHGYWQVLRLLRLFPDMPEAADIRVLADAMLVPAKVAGEVARFERPDGPGASRPYGWAWLLALHAEAERHDGPWGDALAPLAGRLADLMDGYLNRMTYPITVGTHFNSAFAMVLALDWAQGRDARLEATIAARARQWFAGRTDYRGWEPGGDEFLSPALTAALLMSRLLDPPAFAAWFANFLPRADSCEPGALFVPVHVSDRTDGKIAHLDGLNLSRAWCWRGIGAALGDPGRFAPVIDQHVAASLPHIGEDYMGSHWLGSFALLALEHEPCDR